MYDYRNKIMKRQKKSRANPSVPDSTIIFGVDLVHRREIRRGGGGGGGSGEEVISQVSIDMARSDGAFR